MSMVRNNTTAIAQRQAQGIATLNDLPKGPLDKIETLNELFATLHDKVNLICPLAAVDTILPMHQVSLRAVYINPEVNNKGVGPECYRGGGWCDEDEVALGKVALDKLEAAAGVRRIGGGRVDDRSDPYFCEFQVILEITDFDGTKRTAVGTKALDLRDGAPETLKQEWVNRQKTGRMVIMDPSALNAKRQHLISLCETKARLRALRELLGLQQKYTIEDMSKPFVLPKLVPHLDVNDPETKSALIATALGQPTQLYGKPTLQISEAVQLPPEQVPPIKHVEAERIDEATQAGNATQTADDGEDDLAGFAPPATKQTAPEAVCACPCGHQKEITKAREAATIDRVGSARCGECFPGRYYNPNLHKDLTSLGLNGYPNGLTPQEAAKMSAVDKGKK